MAVPGDGLYISEKQCKPLSASSNVFLYIESNIKSEISLNKIITNCSISQGYLSRIFREQFQISVMEYLHMRKIYLAKDIFILPMTALPRWLSDWDIMKAVISARCLRSMKI